MHESGPRSPARLLAPLALVLVAFAVVVVVVASNGNGDDGANASSGGTGGSAPSSVATTPTRPLRKTYTVKTGDTLNAIAEKTGVSVERIEELNPDLDPQALLSGQKITLRE
jgi:LysM repeat protein